MTKIEIDLAMMILENPNLPLRIEIEEKEDLPYHKILRDFREITILQKDYGFYLEDYYYIKSRDFQIYKSYFISKIPSGQEIPTDEELRESYENICWEEIIYIVLDK